MAMMLLSCRSPWFRHAKPTQAKTHVANLTIASLLANNPAWPAKISPHTEKKAIRVQVFHGCHIFHMGASERGYKGGKTGKKLKMAPPFKRSAYDRLVVANLHANDLCERVYPVAGLAPSATWYPGKQESYLKTKHDATACI